MPLYRVILKNAWVTTWRNKLLWPFGFFASFWGIGSAYEVVLRGLNLSGERDLFWPSLLQDFKDLLLNWQTIGTLFKEGPLQLLLFVLMMAGLIFVLLFFVWLFTCSEIAVIKGSANLMRKQPVNNLFFDSRADFWPIFAINLVGKVLIFLFLLLLSYPFLQPLLSSGSYSVWTLLLYLLFFVFILAIILAISFLMILSAISVVVNKTDLATAVKSSWKMFSNNWIICVETSVLLFLINIFFGFLLVLFLMLLSLPLILLIYLVVYLANSIIVFWLVMALSLLLALAAIFVLIGLITTYQLVVWVELFDRISKKGVLSKIERLGSKIVAS